jgi:hypothetical protein
MKTTPTDIDRKAAGLFKCVDGMLAGWCYTSVTSVPPKNRCVWERIRSDDKVPDALDTGDPATAGAMLAQVETMRPGQAVSIVDRLHSLPGENERRFAVIVEHDGAQTVSTGPTRGAALVAAKRALAEVRR